MCSAYHSLTGLDRRQRPAFLSEPGSGRPVNRACYAAANLKFRISRIHHRRDIRLSSNIPFSACQLSFHNSLRTKSVIYMVMGSGPK
jgi:hypothetical protein